MKSVRAGIEILVLQLIGGGVAVRCGVELVEARDVFDSETGSGAVDAALARLAQTRVKMTIPIRITYLGPAVDLSRRNLRPSYVPS